MEFNPFSSHDPIARVRNVEGLIEVLREHCAAEAERSSDQEARLLFEKTANALESMSMEFKTYLFRDAIPWESYSEEVHKSADPWD